MKVLVLLIPCSRRHTSCLCTRRRRVFQGALVQDKVRQGRSWDLIGGAPDQGELRLFLPPPRLLLSGAVDQGVLSCGAGPPKANFFDALSCSTSWYRKGLVCVCVCVCVFSAQYSALVIESSSFTSSSSKSFFSVCCTCQYL